MPTHWNRLQVLNPLWERIQHGWVRAERNLTELEPAGTHALGQPDVALETQRAVNHCLNLITREIDRLHSIIVQYDYPTAGEAAIDVDHRHGMERDQNIYAQPGCISCAQEGARIFTEVDKDSKDLCWWCARFKRAYGFLPTPYLVVKHTEKKTITKALVDRELRPQREAARKLAAAKRPSRKKGKAA